MNSNQKRIVLALAAITVLVFVAVVIASLGGSGDESVAANGTVTSSTTTTSTSEPTTVSTSTTTDPTTVSSTTSSTSTTTTSTTTTTTTTPVAPTLVLRADGLGAVFFGMESEAAVASLTAALGPPDEDSGWIPSFSGFGTCPGEQVRGLRWATMWALMTDGETEWRSDGIPHFFAYLNSVFYDESQSLGLLTEEGIGLGNTVADLRDTYGDRVEITFDELIDSHAFSIVVPAPGWLWGVSTGENDADLITSIDGGSGCGE